MSTTSRIQSEIGQTKRFRSLAQESAVALLRTASQVRHHLDSVVAAEGMTLSQYNVLRILRGAGPDGLPTLQVAERLIERTPGISRMMDRLERKGWVERYRSGEDRRLVRCYLTEDGSRLLAKLDEAVDAADERVTRALTDVERRQLITLLDKVRGDLG